MGLQKQNSGIFKYISIIVVTAFITFVVTSVFGYQYINTNENYYIKTAKSDDSTGTMDRTFTSFKKVLEEKYIGEINEKDMRECAIKGYVAGLNDPYTEYFTKEEMQNFTEETEGQYVGIGIYTTADTSRNAIAILRTIGNSPAYRAGLLTGDIIKKVDDIEYTGEQLNDAIKKIKGAPNTNVKLTILREDKEIEYNITRENIKIEHVSSEVLENNIGYIKISSFEGGASQEFIDNYNNISNSPIRALIIDLRFNGGGIVDEALKIAETMVPKGKTLLITKDKSEEEKIEISKKDPNINVPIVVLVNEYSASASEILAGILKEDIEAKLVGNTTYGKGVIQTVYTLQDGSGLKITTDEYFTPNHNKINKIGIEPTIKVELPEEYRQVVNIPKDQDTQLKRAIDELN